MGTLETHSMNRKARQKESTRSLQPGERLVLVARDQCVIEFIQQIDHHHDGLVVREPVLDRVRPFDRESLPQNRRDAVRKLAQLNGILLGHSCISPFLDSQGELAESRPYSVLPFLFSRPLAHSKKVPPGRAAVVAERRQKRFGNQELRPGSALSTMCT